MSKPTFTDFFHAATDGQKPYGWQVRLAEDPHLSLMQMGADPLDPSWLARILALRDRFIPFHLAYLETLLRATDMRTSAAEAAQQPPHP